MHSEKKYLMMNNGDVDLELNKSQSHLGIITQDLIMSSSGNELKKSSTSNWITTAPTSSNSGAFNKQCNTSKRMTATNMEDYIKSVI